METKREQKNRKKRGEKREENIMGKNVFLYDIKASFVQDEINKIIQWK